MIAKNDPVLLNQKLPREASKVLLDIIGNILLEHTKDLAVRPGPVRDFLEQNGLPPSIYRLLPPDYRAFCLMLNALKQWVTKEQQETDAYLLRRKARKELKVIAGSCIVTGKSLNGDCKFHHPVRDGRPPIPVCSEAHDEIEEQQPKFGKSSDPNLALMAKIVKERNRSWKHLKRGCLDLLGESVTHSSPSMKGDSRSFARKVSGETGLNLQEILALLRKYDLVSD